MPDEPLITIRNFGTPQEAAIAQSLIGNYDIPSFVQGGEVATTLFYVGTALGGVRLDVPESQAERAATSVQRIRFRRQRPRLAMPAMQQRQ